MTDDTAGGIDVGKLVATELKCVWNTGGDCVDDTYDTVIFGSSIQIPICHKHLKDHKNVMILHANNYDVEEVIQKSPEWRQEEVLTLVLSGLSDGEVEL